jgi:hypothetical protein
MPTGIYDSSLITKRRRAKTIAGSFLNRMYPPNGSQPSQGSAPMLGIQDSSIINTVRNGNMTEFQRNSSCVNISVGCPCPGVNAAFSLPPGPISGIVFSVGSIIVSWNAPIGNESFTYRITPRLNGQALNSVLTNLTTYRFTDLEEWQPYTFDICAINADGVCGPTVTSSYFMAPPNTLSQVMSGSPLTVTLEPSVKYIINAGLNAMLQYIAKVNLGPTRGSRYIYVWITSVIGAWNWIRSESHISGTHDNWNWELKASNTLSSNDSIIWLCEVIDYITPFFIPSGYKSIYNCPLDIVTRVKTDGEWNNWLGHWQPWYAYRQADGFSNMPQPTGSANWGQTIVVDNSTINNINDFPAPNEWTRLTVMGKKQNYLTHSWDSVLSSCLTEQDEISIESLVEPSTGLARDSEIDNVKNITASLSDTQKVIAEFWAGGPGTVSPPLMFIWFWKEYIRTVNTVSCSDIMFSLQDLAVHLFEGGRVTWRLKAKYMEARPIQEIRRRYTGSMIESWNGVVDGSQWQPYQEFNFVTPPFADFPSGHSHFSKAFALTMNKWFGENISKITTFYDGEPLICPLFRNSTMSQYGTFIVEPGTSAIESGSVPSSPIQLSFNKWDDMANQAGMSRLYGGIHALSAHTSSQQVAISVDQYINNTWNIQKN